MAGGPISGANIYGLTIRESATDGSDFTNPDADYRRLFLGEDGQLHVKDSAGTVTDIGTGSVATDPIWANAGDTVVATGNDAAAVLPIGAAGGALSVINSAVAWNSGTSFPANKGTGDRYWRTDLAMEFYWDGTRWVSTTLYTMPIGTDSALIPVAANNNALARAATFGSTAMWLATWYSSWYVGSPNDGTKYWTVNLYNGDTGSSLASYNTSAGSAATWSQAVTAVGAATTGFFTLQIGVALTGTTPGNIYVVNHVTYRIIGT